jgi:hypothetical protein
LIEIFYESLTRGRKEGQIAPQASAIQISDCGLRILDFGIAFFFNPHSTIGNPHFGYPRPS